MTTSRQRTAFRQRAVQDPTDVQAIVGGGWPPATRRGLVGCARRIKCAMVLLAAGAPLDQPGKTYIVWVRERVRRSIEYLQQRDRRLATTSVWTARTSAGATVRFPLADGPARLFKEIADGYQGGFEHALHDLIVDSLQPDDIFVDVGAHIGYASAFAATRGAVVFAVEVQRELVPLIEQMASLNGFDQVHVLHAAAGAEAGLLPVHRMPAHPGFQLTEQAVPELEADTIGVMNDFVPSITLDAAFGAGDRIPRLVKIDVEGHELEVLAGARGLIAKARTSFIVEVHGQLLEQMGRQVSELAALFDPEQWSWWQLTDRALRPIADMDDIEPDPNDPNPKLVFRPRSGTP